MSHRDTFNKAEKSFLGGVTKVKNAMHIMLVSATEHRVATMQNGKGGDCSLLTRAYYLAMEAKVIRANDIIPYLETFAGVTFDTENKTDTAKQGQFKVNNDGKVSTVEMQNMPWHEFLKPEADPKPLDLVAKLNALAKQIAKHNENPVKGDNIPAELAAMILAATKSQDMPQA